MPHTSSSAERADVCTRITAEIVTAIEAGAGEWRMPWHHDGAAVTRSQNISSGKRYRGVNVLALWIAAQAHGYADGLWGTYRQWLAIGAQVHKGERGTTVVLCKQAKAATNDDGDDVRRRVFARAFTVFNVAQVDGCEPQVASSFRRASASHRAKGLEADYTILLDVSEGDYGVPSRIEDDELLNLVIPRPESFAYAEERRLFYVALTRASRGVYMITNSRQPSRYIGELCEVAGDEVHFETINCAALRQCPACRVGQLVERRSRDGTVFCGCNQFPDCRHSEPAAWR